MRKKKIRRFKYGYKPLLGENNMAIIQNLEKDYNSLVAYLKTRLGHTNSDIKNMIAKGEKMLGETGLKSGAAATEAERPNALAQPQTMDERVNQQNELEAEKK
jgi:hypothetical protein